MFPCPLSRRERVRVRGLHPHTSACFIHDLRRNLCIALLTGKFFNTPAHHSTHKARSTLQALLGFHSPTQVPLGSVKSVLNHGGEGATRTWGLQRFCDALGRVC